MPTPMPTDTYITMSGVDWETFEGLSNRTRGGRIRYNDGELEIMSPSIFHEDFGGGLVALVDAFAEALGIDAIGVGSTTWKAPAANKGVEADAAFYLDPTKLPGVAALMAAAEKDITRYPAVDLVIEIDIRRPDAERSGVYAAVGAVEVWEYDGEAVRILRLGPGGSYAEVDRSGWFPVTAAGIASAIRDAPSGRTSRRKWMRAFVAEQPGAEG